MKRKLTAFVTLLALMCVLLGGCFVVDLPLEVLPGLLPDLSPVEPPATPPSAIPSGPSPDYTGITFDEMVYTSPEPEEFVQQVDFCIKLAAGTTNVAELMEQVELCYELYCIFDTNYSLSMIYNSKDVTDDYWYNEYSYCMEVEPQFSANWDELLYALADCPLKDKLEADDFFGEGFFDDYQGESIWDKTYIALSEEENALLSQYYDLTGQMAEMDEASLEYGQCQEQMENVYIELVKVRQSIARHLGYDNYMDYAYEEMYYRDYTPEQGMVLMDGIRRGLVDTYMELPDTVWRPLWQDWQTEETYDYVATLAYNMGDTVYDAFCLMENGQLYDLNISANKYDSSFETYLYAYEVPYLFVNPSGTGGDPFTFAHEFGHFCNDYASGGTDVNIDVAEVFSQAMEYLSLEYGDATHAMTEMKLAETVSTMVEQSALASFEYRVYSMSERQLTPENVRRAYAESLESYGLYGGDGSYYINIPHYFISPMYIISYVVSADVAFQYYQLELDQPGAGLALLHRTLDTEHTQILSFVNSVGLESPFFQGRADAIRQTVEELMD